MIPLQWSLGDITEERLKRSLPNGRLSWLQWSLGDITEERYLTVLSGGPPSLLQWSLGDITEESPTNAMVEFMRAGTLQWSLGDITEESQQVVWTHLLDLASMEPR